MKKVGLIFLAVMLFAGPGTAFAQRRPARQITIKLASMVPANTPWGAALNRMASEWSAATNGEVRMQIYPNGTQGSEADVLQKLNMNVIQAAVFTSFGLNKIVPEILTVSCPLLFRNDDELTAVFDVIKPDLEAKINSKDYYSMALVRGGWIKIFSKEPVFVPADLKRMKVGSDPQEPAMTQAFKSMGYQVVPIEANRTLIALNGGTIEAIYVSPIASAGMQYFGVAKNMSTVNIAPFLGGIVMNKHTWEMIPEQHRAEILKITRRIGMEIETSLAQLESDAITTMTRHGLVINDLNSRQQQEWYDDLEKAIPALLEGATFDRTTYDKINGLVKTHRGGR
ncbi:TRAP transporter substrate-binding protein DctP [Treponema primitia]|uniref:TRAP transporter substrate-binding protein n=1 Tax=Treponema primitia TaxID=88058 RepID=UPI0002554E7E|nr:TRAP transporter substrate-binding protein DctP [Treponema primitia]